LDYDDNNVNATIPVSTPIGVYDAANKGYVDTKVSIPTTAGAIYGDGKGSTTTIPVLANDATGNSIVQRTSDGRVKVAAPNAEKDAVNLKYANDNYSTKQYVEEQRDSVMYEFERDIPYNPRQWISPTDVTTVALERQLNDTVLDIANVILSGYVVING
jgi:hypothetical protein